MGLTVPDLDEAVAFFTDVLGCELLWRTGPLFDPDGAWMTVHLGVPPRAALTLAMLRCGPVTNLELLAWEPVADHRHAPRLCDMGAPHLALLVDDLDAALERLHAESTVRVLGAPTLLTGEPCEGTRFVFFLTPWGLPLELTQRPRHLPYELTCRARLYRPAAAWGESRSETRDRTGAV